ncbi:MAG TPA: hypothetical protein VFD82_08280 [Planctomycetota bacterium]|nr:hypothetical protein [Planctomycetota bacterium]
MAKAPARFLPRAILFGVGLAGLLLVLSRPHPGSAERVEGIAPTKAEIERLLRLEITALEAEVAIDTPWGALAAKPATRGQVDRYLPLLCQELRKYPPELIARIGLRRVVLCRDLSLGKQPRAAVPLRDHDSLHLDVVAGHYSCDYQRIVVHHELMHVIDDRDDGKVYEDGEWAALNATQFRYGNGGIHAQHDQRASLHTTGVQGFLTSYATTAVEEDKAELFARLMVEPDYVAKRAEEDAILRAKVARLRELLLAFCPQFDGRAWPDTAPRV